MDSTSAAIVSSATAAAQASVQTAVSTSVLRKALDVQAQNAAALIQALPSPAALATRSVGSLVDVYV